MISITLSDAGKRYNREWIFRHLSYTFQPDTAYAITGPNGSGKSTLLQVVAGAVGVSEGKINYNNAAAVIEDAGIYQYIAYAAPYLELIEEMTLREFLVFHTQFKSFYPGITPEAAAEAVSLTKALNKQIVNFSSGMKQRLKLAQAFFSNTPVLLLDEPTSNLDAEGIAVYHNLVQQYTKNRLVVVSSNDEGEYSFCREVVRISDYK